MNDSNTNKKIADEDLKKYVRDLVKTEIEVSKNEVEKYNINHIGT